MKLDLKIDCNPTGDAHIIDQIAAWLRQKRGVAVATIISTIGSSPRPVGSMLAVDEDGLFLGSVSSGCIEATVITEAVDVLHKDRPHCLLFEAAAPGSSRGMLACGGQLEIYLELANQSKETWLETARRLAMGSISILTTDLENGQKRLIEPENPTSFADLQEGEVDAIWDVLATERCRIATIGQNRCFLQLLGPTRHLVIVGAVHIAQFLAPMAIMAGFKVTVIEPREAFSESVPIPGALISTERPEKVFEAMHINEHTAIVTLTHDCMLDDRALESALRSKAFFIGALGSRRTHEARKDRLRHLGFSANDVSRIHGPVGLDLGGQTPAEIAVSIIAELVQARYHSPLPQLKTIIS